MKKEKQSFGPAEIAEKVSSQFPKIKPKDLEEVVKAVFPAIVDLMEAGEKDVRIIKFGTFFKKHRPDRVCRNPKTNMAVEVAANDVLRFDASGIVFRG